MCIYTYVCVCVHIYDGILLSHKKKQNCIICEVDRSRVCHRVKSVRKRKTSYRVSMHVSGMQKDGNRRACMQGRSREENIANRYVDMAGGGEGKKRRGDE